MSETIEQARTLIETRLHDIEAEATHLKESLEALGSGHSPRTPRKGSKGGTRRPTRKRRVPRGQRREQFLDAVRKTPGAKASEVAKEIGISADQAYGLARQLVKSGEIKKSGKGYRPRSNSNG